jgi:hypothetical protein
MDQKDACGSDCGSKGLLENKSESNNNFALAFKNLMNEKFFIAQ